MNNEETSKDGTTLRDNSIPTASNNGSALKDFLVFEGHQHHQNQPARDHPKWPEFVAWCRSKRGLPTKKRGGRVHDGIPTENGFWKWLLGQKPYWRNKVKPHASQGYVLDGKFYTPEVANRLAGENADLIKRFHRAHKDSHGHVFKD